MTALNSSPLNPNFLSRSGFKFIVTRAPDLNFYVQKINVPAVSIVPTIQPNPFVDIPHSGDHIEYDVLSVTFKVDEDMLNWYSMWTWLHGLGFPNRHNEYEELKSGSKLDGLGIESDLKLFILTSHRNPKVEITFKDAFPIDLAGLDFDSTSSDVDYVESTVSFKYRSYDLFFGPF